MNNTSIISLNGTSRTDFLTQVFRAVLKQDFDCHLIVDEQSIPCHRLILMASSMGFYKHFSQENPCSKIAVMGLKHRDVLDVLRYVYTGSISIEANRLADVMQAAKKLGVTLPVEVQLPNKIQIQPTSPKIIKVQAVRISNSENIDESSSPSIPQKVQKDSLLPKVLKRNFLSVSKPDNNGIPTILRELGLQREKNSLPKECEVKKSISTSTLLKNHESIIVDDSDEDENKSQHNAMTPKQFIDPTKIIKKRNLRPNRKVDYEQLNTFGIKNKSNHNCRLFFCMYCGIQCFDIPSHTRLCKMNPIKKIYQARRKTTA